MTLEAKKCVTCGANLESPRECAHCGTVYEFETNPKSIDTESWKQKVIDQMGDSHYLDGLHYTADGVALLVAAYRGDGPEVTVRAEYEASQETIDRLTKSGLIF